MIDLQRFPLLGDEGYTIIALEKFPGDLYQIMIRVRGKYQRDLSRTPRMFRLTPPDTAEDNADTDIGDPVSDFFKIRSLPVGMHGPK
jgi:hypothetical protein